MKKLLSVENTSVLVENYLFKTKINLRFFILCTTRFDNNVFIFIVAKYRNFILRILF